MINKGNHSTKTLPLVICQSFTMGLISALVGHLLDQADWPHASCYLFLVECCYFCSLAQLQCLVFLADWSPARRMPTSQVQIPYGTIICFSVFQTQILCRNICHSYIFMLELTQGKSVSLKQYKSLKGRIGTTYDLIAYLKRQP